MIAEDEVRRRITAELGLLRDLCRALITVARAATGEESQRGAIRDVLCQICVVVERHFKFEEEVVVPMLLDADPWGPVRVERLFQERDEQRSMLFALANDARDALRSTDDLADEVIGFFRSFEQQIIEAETRLLEAEAAGADPVIDQIDG